jgi:hypothetical protein
VGRDGPGNLPKIARVDHQGSYGYPETCPQSLCAKSHFDITTEGKGQEPHPHYMLPIHSGTAREGSRFGEGLIIKPTGQKYGEYQRIGAFIVEKELWVMQLERLIRVSKSLPEDEYTIKILRKARIEKYIITVI